MVYVGEVYNLKGRTINTGELDDLIEYLYEGHIKPLGFSKDGHNLYYCKSLDKLMRFKIEFIKKSGIRRKNIIKILGVD